MVTEGADVPKPSRGMSGRGEGEKAAGALFTGIPNVL